MEAIEGKAEIEERRKRFFLCYVALNYGVQGVNRHTTLTAVRFYVTYSNVNYEQIEEKTTLYTSLKKKAVHHLNVTDTMC